MSIQSPPLPLPNLLHPTLRTQDTRKDTDLLGRPRESVHQKYSIYCRRYGALRFETTAHGRTAIDYGHGRYDRRSPSPDNGGRYGRGVSLSLSLSSFLTVGRKLG